MFVLKEHAQRLNKGGRITDLEIIEYLSKHPDDMAWMLGNLHDPFLDCRPLFIKIQRWLAYEKLGRMNDIKQMPSQYHLDVSDNNVVPMAGGMTEQMRMDHLLAMSLHDEEVARNLANQKKNVVHSPPARPAPVRSNHKGGWRGNASSPQSEIVLKCIETFKTRGHPNELIQKNWSVRVIQEQFDDGAHLVLVDHGGLKCKQWLGGPDMKHFEGLKKLKWGYRYPVQKQEPSAPPKPSSPSAPSRPLPNPPPKDPVKQEEKKKEPAKQEEKKKDPAIGIVNKLLTACKQEDKKKEPAKQEEKKREPEKKEE